MNMMSPWFTRRNFLKSASVAALAPLATRAFGADSRGILAFIGTYTSAPTEPFGPPGGNSDGIYRAWLDPHTGELKDIELAAKTRNPSWLAVHPSRRYLYTLNEVADFEGGSGSVTAYALDTVSGTLTELNSTSSQGPGPAHMSLDHTGRYAFVANYLGGSVAVLPIDGNGKLDSAIQVIHHQGHVGAKRATDAPRGSFAISGHDAPHAHMIAPSPDNRFVISTDLGQDRIYVYRFDVRTGKLSNNSGTPIVTVPTGDGPRHFAFHPNGQWLYTLQEESSTLSFYHFDTERGALQHVQTISSLPFGFAGTNFGSEILVSSDGEFLYAANRLHDSVSICTIGTDGRISLRRNTHTQGDYPRNIALGPNGKYLFSCNQHSDNIVSFRRDESSGLLSPTGHYAAVGSPAFITFLA
ncbi:MAG: lactonase family protein [Acidobacteriota bacterium]|nr:lactonase family protein [Acidobacteriota bacterium]